jgi:predicted metal-binding protein
MVKTTGPVASACYAVAQSAPHQSLVCKACRHKCDACKPGRDLLKKLRAAIAMTDLGDQFELSGTACRAGCVAAHGAPCVVGYRATKKAILLVGDIDPDQPLEDLVSFARSYAARDDGWMPGRDLPPRLSDTTLARIPAAIIVTQEGALQ